MCSSLPLNAEQGDQRWGRARKRQDFGYSLRQQEITEAVRRNNANEATCKEEKGAERQPLI